MMKTIGGILLFNWFYNKKLVKFNNIGYIL